VPYILYALKQGRNCFLKGENDELWIGARRQKGEARLRGGRG